MMIVDPHGGCGEAEQLHDRMWVTQLRPWGGFGGGDSYESAQMLGGHTHSL